MKSSYRSGIILSDWQTMKSPDIVIKMKLRLLSVSPLLAGPLELDWPLFDL